MQFKGFENGQAILEIGLDVYLDKGKTVTLKINNHNLLDWYPLDKMAEYRYNTAEHTVYLRPNGGTNSENWSVLPNMSISRKAIRSGIVPVVKEHNEHIIQQAYNMFKLPSPNSLTTLEQVEEQINQVLVILNDLEEQLRILPFYVKDDKILEETKKQINENITLVGTMYRWYSLVRKAV